ncbi:hypothetical protein Leryth_006466 [Lithospermum erythrorhizon]|nr:hypothetical protein Leryth_006466 [Lithospermum erythrorhizon]
MTSSLDIETMTKERSSINFSRDEQSSIPSSFLNLTLVFLRLKYLRRIKLKISSGISVNGAPLKSNTFISLPLTRRIVDRNGFCIVLAPLNSNKTSERRDLHIFLGCSVLQLLQPWIAKRLTLS